MSLRDWFLAPAPAGRRAPPEPADDAATAWAPPVDSAAQTPAPRDTAAPWAPPADAAPAHVEPDDFAPPAHDSAAAWAPPADAAPAYIPASGNASPASIVAPAIGSAAVIGRPGEAEPVAAGVALALRGRAPAAAVIVVAEHAEPNAEGGTRAARRLAARLDAHGFAAGARGRLAWAYVEPDAARRAARVAGEPVVLAITVPLDSVLELAIGDQDLAIVVARDERGPLAQIATASLAGHRVTTTKPLPRGLPRVLARHGLRAPAELQNVLRA